MTTLQLQDLSQNLIDLYIEMETLLLNNIARKINRDNKLFKEIDNTNIADWQLERLKDINGLTEENIKIIAKGTKKTSKEIENIFKMALKDNVDSDIISLGIKKGLLNRVNDRQIILNALSIANSSTKNTFNQLNNNVLKSTKEVYTKIINQVSTNVLSGIETTQQATVNAVKRMVNDGLTGFTTNSGAKWSPEAYASMVIRSNVKNIINDVQDIRIREAGGNYIEINSYVGARPKCSEDQGRIFSLNGDITPIKDINGRIIEPRRWEDSSFGEPDGILGINCGHQKFLFVPELGSFNREKINKKENDKVYEEKQQQRYLEREIRKAKREKSALENVGADKLSIKKEQTKISDRQQQMREFINETGRTRRTAREKVVTGN